MRKIIFNLIPFFLLPIITMAQSPVVQDGSASKVAQVDVTLTDFATPPNPMAHEIMIFRGMKYGREYQGLTDSTGRFSIRVPVGDKYNIYVLGFTDSTSYDLLDVPDPGAGKSYKKPFEVSYQFLPAKNWELEGCNFDNGKSTLQESSYTVLDKLLAYMVRKEDDKIEIGGHTDNVGSAKSNMELSLARANTVRDYLVSKGVATERITTKGYGMTKPIAKNTTAAGRADNRRIEVTILE